MAPPDDELDYLHGQHGSADLDVVLIFNLLRTHSHLSPFIDAHLRSQDPRGLTSAQLNALLALRNAGENGLLMREISLALVVAKSNVTALVDRLEAQGLVSRAGHRDRRATVVRLTPAGAGLLDRIVPKHHSMLSELVSDLTTGLTESEKKTLVRLLTKLRRGLREKGARKS